MDESGGDISLCLRDRDGEGKECSLNARKEGDGVKSGHAVFR